MNQDKFDIVSNMNNLFKTIVKVNSRKEYETNEQDEKESENESNSL